MPGIDSLSSAGAILCDASSPLIRDNTFANNTVDMEAGFWSQGGAIGCQFESQAVIEGNTFIGNSAHWGGAIISWFASPLITGNTFTENTGWGAAIYTGFDSPNPVTITNNTIVNNTAPPRIYGGGGGIECTYSSSALIEGNTISKNSAFQGGGMLVYAASPLILNNTITENTARGFGAVCGGILVWEQSEVEILNTILWSDFEPNPPAGKEIYIGSSSTVTINYSDVDGGQESIEVEDGSVLNWGEGMIDADPVFVLPEKRDYRLLWESPCIDAGDPADLDPDGSRIDMGAHYFDQDDFLTLYITPDTTEVTKGGQLRVTYTAINRWSQPEAFWALSQVLLPGGSALDVLGPDRYTLPANYTAQVQISHPVPMTAPAGACDYWSRIGMPPSTLYDEDRFTFMVIE